MALQVTKPWPRLTKPWAHKPWPCQSESDQTLDIKNKSCQSELSNL